MAWLRVDARPLMPRLRSELAALPRWPGKATASWPTPWQVSKRSSA